MATFTPSSDASATKASTASPATVNVQIYCNELHSSLIRFWNGNVSKTLLQFCISSGQVYDPNNLAAEVDKAKTRTESSNDVFTMPLSKVPICEGEELYIFRISPNPKDPGFFKRLISALHTLEQSMVSEQTACSSASEQTACSSASEQTACSSASVAPPKAEFASFIEGVKKATLSRLICEWQCCHGCNDGCAFPFGNEDTAIMVHFILRNGGTVLYADFALKSLIKQGIDVFQGIKPFAQTGEIARRGFTDDGSHKLRFDPKKLLNCGSPQLQAIATMNTGVMTSPQGSDNLPATTATGSSLATVPGAPDKDGQVAGGSLSPWSSKGMSDSFIRVVNQPSVRKVLPFIIMLAATKYYTKYTIASTIVHSSTSI
jgi:hypothetical protein